MGNCLVTKLKGTVDNEFLPPYDSATLRFLPHAENARFRLLCSDAVIKLAGNAEIWDNENNVSLGKTATLGSSITHFHDLSITPCNSECLLFILPKYGQRFSIKEATEYLGFDLNEIKYLGIVQSVYLPQIDSLELNNNIYGSINSLNGKEITKLQLSSDNIEGNITDLLNSYTNKSGVMEFFVQGENLECTLGDWSAFTGITNMFGFGTPKATGVFSSLASMPNLTRVRSSYDMPLITGSVEDFVAIAKTRGAGSLMFSSIKRKMPNITYNGIALKDNDAVSYNVKYLNWDAAGNITWS